MSSRGNAAVEKSSNRISSFLPQKETFLDLSPEHLLSAYSRMLEARIIDHKIIILYKQNLCRFQIGPAGHEAVQIAAGNFFRSNHDWFYPYYRDLAFLLTVGMKDRDFFLNAMNKRDDPNGHGRQMPMHYGHADLQIVNQSSPTGSQFVQATGCALGARKKGLDQIVYVSSGDGACSQGDFHEALNWSAREKLPVLFMIENNGFAISVPVAEQIAGGSIARLVSGYPNLKALEVDGTDYVESYSVLQQAYSHLRSGKGPALIEAHVPRLQSHSISDCQEKYLSRLDLERNRKRCPIEKLKKILCESGIASQSQLSTIESEIKERIDQSAQWAIEQPNNDPKTLLDFTWSDSSILTTVRESEPSGASVYMIDAINQALDEELDHNPDVYLFGQDVAGGKGGVFGATANLTDKYGKERVFNAPLAESSIIGVSIGMAAQGLKPVVEIQFADFIWTAMNQLRNELAMMHHRSAGDFSCPVTVRVPVGGYIHGGPYHSQTIEGTFSHFPGLYIVYPSNAADAKGLLKTAVRCHNPVLFLEPKGLYRQPYAKKAVGGKDFFVPFGKAKVLSEGADATVLCWGALVEKSLRAAATLVKKGYSIEVIDLRSIVPLDTETISSSIKKTSRVLIAHEDNEFMGFGAELAAQIADRCFTYLDAPVKRVGAKCAASIPHDPILEEGMLPQENDILEALYSLLSF